MKKICLLMLAVIVAVFSGCSGFLPFGGADVVVALAEERIESENYEGYGVSSTALSSYLLTATVTPEGAANVSFSIAFADPSGTWAKGKKPADYVTLTDNGNNTATVSCMQAFGEPIIVTASAGAAKGTCTLQYERRLEGFDIKFTPTTNKTGAAKAFSLTGVSTGNNLGGIAWYETYTISVTPAMSNIYTLDKTVTVTSVKIQLPKAKWSTFKSYGYNPLGSSALTVTNNGSTVFDDAALKTVFGLNAVDNKSSIYSALRSLSGSFPFTFIVTTSAGSGYGFTGYLDVYYASMK